MYVISVQQSVYIVVLAFHCCDKIPEISKLQGGKVYFGSQFEISCPYHLPYCFWACGEAEHNGGECVVEQSYSSHAGWEGVGVTISTLGPPQW
jgi:hypothetical protein